MTDSLQEYKDTDIVASDIYGIIAEYSAIKVILMSDDSIRLATIEEQFLRNDTPNESKIK